MMVKLAGVPAGWDRYQVARWGYGGNKKTEKAGERRYEVLDRALTALRESGLRGEPPRPELLAHAGTRMGDRMAARPHRA